MQWMPGLCFFLLLATLILGLIKLGTSATIASPACISIVWIVYALIPEALVMYYACVSKACAPPVVQLLLGQQWKSLVVMYGDRGAI